MQWLIGTRAGQAKVTDFNEKCPDQKISVLHQRQGTLEDRKDNKEEKADDTQSHETAQEKD